MEIIYRLQKIVKIVLKMNSKGDQAILARIFRSTLGRANLTGANFSSAILIDYPLKPSSMNKDLFPSDCKKANFQDSIIDTEQLVDFLREHSAIKCLMQ